MKRNGLACVLTSSPKVSGQSSIKGLHVFIRVSDILFFFSWVQFWLEWTMKYEVWSLDIETKSE
jgi:hypothetical protein